MTTLTSPQNNLPPIQKRGLHNWKNLFRKPNGYEITIFIMLILGGIMAYSYKVETQMCRETLDNLEVIACKVCSEHLKIDDLIKQTNDERNAALANISYTNLFPPENSVNLSQKNVTS